MGKKSKEKQMRLNGKRINLLHYTNESYLEVFPQAIQTDFEAYQLQNEEQHVKDIEKENNLYFSLIRRVVVDEEYFTWLQVNQLTNVVESRVHYAEILSDEDVRRLWTKNQMDRTIVLKTLPVVLESSEPISQHPVSLSEVQTRDVIALIAQAFHVPKENVYIHKQLVSSLHCTTTFLEERLLTSAEAYFMDSTKRKDEQLPNIPMDEERNVARFLPFVVLCEQKPIQSRKEFQKEAWGLPQLPLVSLEKWATELLEASKEKEIVKVVPILLTQQEVQEFYEGFVTQTKREQNLAINSGK